MFVSEICHVCRTGGMSAVCVSDICHVCRTGGMSAVFGSDICHVCRTGGMSAVFGSEEKMVNVETWRAVHILRGHTGGQKFRLSINLLLLLVVAEIMVFWVVITITSNYLKDQKRKTK